MSTDKPEPISFKPQTPRLTLADVMLAEHNQGIVASNGGDQQAKPAGAPVEKPHEKASLLEDFGRSAVYTLAQTPINALLQPIDRNFGTKILPNVQFIDAPQHAEFGTSNYWAQQTGSALGMMGTFWVAGKGVKAITRGGLTEAAMVNTLSRQSQIGLTLKEAALTGFAHDFAFRPIEEGDTRNYLWARTTNGLTGAATMYAMARTGIGLKQLGSAASVERSAAVPLGQSSFSKFFTTGADKLRMNVAAPLLKNDIAGASLASLPAGLVSANLHSLFKDGRLATGKENYESMVTMGVLGLGFGAHQQFKGRHESGRQNFEWAQKTPSENVQSRAEFKILGGEKALNEALAKVRSGEGAMVKVREHLGESSGIKRFLGMQEYGPKKDLFIQHNDAAKGINYDAAKMADLLAICNLEGALQAKSVVSGESMTLRAGKDRISISSEGQTIREGESKPIPLGDRALFYGENMNNILRRTSQIGEESSVNDIVRQQLKETGLDAKGWKSVISEKNSAMDMIGADIILYNEKTGQMYMLDCTEQAKNPPAIRAAGIIEIQKSWFRANGNGPEMPDWFPKEVGQILMKATGEAGGPKPALNLKDILLPSIKAGPEVEQLTEMRQFVHNLERLSSDPGFKGNRAMVQEYAQKLKDTTLDHLEWTVLGAPNPKVRLSAEESARDVIVEYFTGKRDVKPDYGDTDVYIKHDNVNPEKHEIRFRSTHGDRVQIGRMGEILEKARRDMLPLSPTRAQQVETAVADLRTKIKRQDAVIDAIYEKRQRADNWNEFRSYEEELRVAREEHKKLVDELKPWTPENQLIQRIKKAGRTVQEFQQFLMNDQGAIRNGGRVGTVNPNKPGSIEQALKNHLTKKSEEALFRESTNGERVLKPHEEAGVSAANAKELQDAVRNDWGVLQLQKGVMDENLGLTLLEIADRNATFRKLAEGYTKEDPEAIRIVHRLLQDR